MAETLQSLQSHQLNLFDLEQHIGDFERPHQVGSAQITYQTTRDILTRATGFMDAYDYTLNPYSGCSFGCTYCYAAFFATSVDERDQWGYWVKVKENAIESLAKRKSGGLDHKLIYMSSVTDPYQPIERSLRLTQRLLEILSESHKPKLVVQTRSPDVIRDSKLFKTIIDRGGRVQVNMTVTTDDEEVRSSFEPFCPANKRRLEAISKISKSNIDACITMTPLIWVNDAQKFADDLSKTGVKKFIVQPFHLTRGKFVAGTREAALKIMNDKLLDTSDSTYEEHYAKVFDVLRCQLSHHGCFGEGKDGFSPPF